MIARYRSVCPGVEVRLMESDDNEFLRRALRQGDLDAAFVVNPEQPDLDGLVCVELLRDAFVAVAPLSDAWLPQPRSTRDLAGLPLIGQQPTACQYLIDRGLRSFGIEPSYVFRSSDNGAVQAMVRAGMGGASYCLARRGGITHTSASDRFLALPRQVCGKWPLPWRVRGQLADNAAALSALP